MILYSCGALSDIASGATSGGMMTVLKPLRILAIATVAIGLAGVSASAAPARHASHEKLIHDKEARVARIEAKLRERERAFDALEGRLNAQLRKGEQRFNQLATHCNESESVSSYCFGLIHDFEENFPARQEAVSQRISDFVGEKLDPLAAEIKRLNHEISELRGG